MNYTTNRTYHILFAIQLACIPLVQFGYIMHKEWLPLLFFLLILASRLWGIAYFNKINPKHYLLKMIADACVYTYMLLFICIISSFSVWYMIISVLLTLAFVAIEYITYTRPMGDMLISYDFSFRFFINVAFLFFFITLYNGADLAFWIKASLVSACVLAALSIGIKFYNAFYKKWRAAKQSQFKTKRRK